MCSLITYQALAVSLPQMVATVKSLSRQGGPVVQDCTQSVISCSTIAHPSRMLLRETSRSVQLCGRSRVNMESIDEDVCRLFGQVDVLKWCNCDLDGMGLLVCVYISLDSLSP